MSNRAEGRGPAVFAVGLAHGCASLPNDDVGTAAHERRCQRASPSVGEPVAKIVLVGDTMSDGELALEASGLPREEYVPLLTNLETWAPTPLSEASVAVE